MIHIHGIGSYPLLEPDEGRYAEIPREMIESGDYNTPRLNYVKYFEKPALFYWMNALSFTIFGENEFAARFPTVLMAVLGALLTYVLARSVHCRDTAVCSSVILLTMLLYLGVGQINIIDMTLSFFITLSLTGFWLKRYRLFYTGMALALLSKGLIGVVLPGGIVFWYIVLSRQWRLFKEILTSFGGIFLFFAISLPWFISVCAVNGDFFYFFFVQEHFLRYATKMHDRYQPVWFYIPILILGVMPWAGLIPGALSSLFGIRKTEDENEKRALIFFYLWITIIFVFFSLSGSKLIPYIVPVLPPLAVIFAASIIKMLNSGDLKLAKKILLWGAPLFVAIFIASIIYPFMDKHEIGIFKLWSYAVPLGLVSLAFPVMGFYCVKKENIKMFVFGMLVLSLFFSAAAKRGFVLMGETRSAYDTAKLISEHKREGDLVAQIWDYDQGLPFYLKQRIVLIEWLGELEFGAAQESDPMWFFRSDKLRGFCDDHGRVFFVVEKRRKDRFESLLTSFDIGVPELLGENDRNAVYLKE
ncbi:MAG: glycosyltransferase family 39 protein [Synergistaceae bacterium]|nr:glycosyltransferase family 39 protein [Synergistaceae bacterium]